LSYHAWTRNHLILATLRDVRRRLEVLTPADGPWRRAELPGVPEFAHADLVDTDSYDSDEYMLESTGFTQPGTLRYGHIGGAGGRGNRSSRRRRSSTPRRSGCGSSSPPRRTAPPSPISSSGPPSRAPGRSCSPGTAASKSRSPRPTAGSSAAAGLPAAGPTWW